MTKETDVPRISVKKRGSVSGDGEVDGTNPFSSLIRLSLIAQERGSIYIPNPQVSFNLKPSVGIGDVKNRLKISRGQIATG